MRPLIVALLVVLGAGTARADCERATFEGQGFAVCRADPASDDIRLWLRGADGEVYGTFNRLDAALAEDGLRLAFAMNGGMYHEDRRPVGHYVEEGVEAMRVVTREGPGNFGMLPNGVLCLNDGRARIIESRAFAADPPDCRFATQSGPLMVSGGALHPKFRASSTSRFIRNGVGVTPTGELVMAISDWPVTFHTFARFFRDALDAPDALYIDGNVSRLYAPALSRDDPGLPMGPILGVVVPVD